MEIPISGPSGKARFMKNLAAVTPRCMRRPDLSRVRNYSGSELISALLGQSAADSHCATRPATSRRSKNSVGNGGMGRGTWRNAAPPHSGDLRGASRRTRRTSIPPPPCPPPEPLREAASFPAARSTGGRGSASGGGGISRGQAERGLGHRRKNREGREGRELLAQQPPHQGSRVEAPRGKG